jgi:hypothetical protein
MLQTAMNDRLPPHDKGIAHKVAAGLLLGSFFYLVVSCFEAAELHKPKIDRTQFRFNHALPDSL